MEKRKKDFIAYQFMTNNGHHINVEKYLPEDRIIKIQQFFCGELYGSFFSCIYKGKLRIHIVFSKDCDKYNPEILNLIQETIDITKLTSGIVWICNYNHKIIEYLKNQLQIKQDSEVFCYDSYELIMPRKKYTYKYDGTLLEVRPYQKEHLDEYLLLLTKSMAFKIPPYNYVLEKDKFADDFEILKEKNAFEAFWIKDELIGLYWLEGTEIDHLAVSTKYQRQGFGKQILSRAIEVIFQNPEIDCAWLLVVGWNSQAFNFYKKYGMEQKNVYHVPYSEY